MSKVFFSRGKLLLSGEYFVLEGAQALAVPLKVGQYLSVEKNVQAKPEISWETSINHKLWFMASFELNNLCIIDTSDLMIAKYLQKLLRIIQRKSKVLADNQAVMIKSSLDFLPEWGLGSSSSLISNLAYWADMDPYELLFSVSPGSGYDIASARSETPILYQRIEQPVIHPVRFMPDFMDNLYFVYLGKKQDSRKSVQQKRIFIQGKELDKKRISELTKFIAEAETLIEFEEYLNEHEAVVSKAIKQDSVKSKYFSDFKGSIKSLGAWGGDFVLATHRGDPKELKDYFKQKGLEIIFPYKVLVI
ncbi:MAG: GYDIA family GHMP kinase [Bacteroidales bacterium]|jgi:mevalonate kinase|nr:GYDIA family GHMP kinase [Bacteroidales bacterium]